MDRKPATIENIVPGCTVWPGRTSKRAFLVRGIETEADYPDAPPLVWAKREGYVEAWFTMDELWTRA